MPRRQPTPPDPMLRLPSDAMPTLPPPTTTPTPTSTRSTPTARPTPARAPVERRLASTAADLLLDAPIVVETPGRSILPTAAAPAAPPEPVPDAPPAAVPYAALGTDNRPQFQFLCGPAGSGKTFQTRQWAEDDPGILLAATTGIAAINLGGETINSILGFFDTASLQEKYISGFLTSQLGKLWKAGVRRLVIDEVSMLAADQLTFLARAIDEVNGRGYVLGKWADDDDTPPPAMSLTLVGDFLQLSPVKAQYAFESPEWEKFAPHVHNLTTMYRQTDPDFLAALRAARLGDGRTVADYFISRNAIHHETDDHFDGSTILAKNDAVDRYNALRMAQLQGREIRWPSSRWGKQRTEWGNPDKPPATWGIPEALTLKVGALVMVLSNARDENRVLQYVNGDLGTVLSVDPLGIWVELQRTGHPTLIRPVERKVRIPCDGARRKELRALGQEALIDGKWEVVGGIVYMPLRPAWASTVHKSQGLSLDRAQINARDHFFSAPGMLYVALSRARTAVGLRLVGSPKTLIDRCTVDPRVRAWL